MRVVDVWLMVALKASTAAICWAMADDDGVMVSCGTDMCDA